MLADLIFTKSSYVMFVARRRGEDAATSPPQAVSRERKLASDRQGAVLRCNSDAGRRGVERLRRKRSCACSGERRTFTPRRRFMQCCDHGSIPQSQDISGDAEVVSKPKDDERVGPLRFLFVRWRGFSGVKSSEVEDKEQKLQRNI